MEIVDCRSTCSLAKRLFVFFIVVGSSREFVKVSERCFGRVVGVLSGAVRVCRERCFLVLGFIIIGTVAYCLFVSV